MVVKLIKKITVCMFVTMITFLLGVVGANTYNYYNSEYEIIFNVNEEFDYQKLMNQDYLLSIVNSNDKYSEIDIEKMIENDDVNIELVDEGYKIVTGYQYYAEFFISKDKIKSSRVKKFYMDAIENLVSENAVVSYKYENVYIVRNNINIYLIGGILGGLGLTTSILYYVYNKSEYEFEYDNANIYRTPFHTNYWKESVKFLDSPKKMVTIAMLFSIMMVCKMFSLPSGFSNLGLSLTYLFFALISLIYGPIAGFTIGFLSDILGFFLFDRSGLTFNFGYTIQAMLAGFTYGIFLYKTKISFLRCFFSRLVVNLILNVIYGSICFGYVMGWDYEIIKSYALIMELPKNIIYLVPQTILLFIFLKSISPILYRNKYINKMIYENIKNK